MPIWNLELGVKGPQDFNIKEVWLAPSYPNLPIPKVYICDWSSHSQSEKFNLLIYHDYKTRFYRFVLTKQKYYIFHRASLTSVVLCLEVFKLCFVKLYRLSKGVQ